MPTKHDPLVGVGNARIAAANLRKEILDQGGGDGSHHVTLRTFTLAGISWLGFGFALLLFCRLYHHVPFFTVVVASLVMFSGFAVASVSKYREAWQESMGSFFVGSLVIGTMVGLNIYYRYFIFYDHYMEAKVYTNVAASQPAALFADAGMLGLSVDSRLDASRSVGYHSPRLGRTLCVAPIVDSSSDIATPVSLYGSGVDCCHYRSNFRCDDALDPLAASALLRLPGDVLTNPWMEWAVEDPLEVDGFAKAVKLQSAVYGTKVADKVRFVRWSRDPRKLRDRYLEHGFAAVCGAAALFGLLSTFFALVVVLGPMRIRLLISSTEHAALTALRRTHAFSRLHHAEQRAGDA